MMNAQLFFILSIYLIALSVGAYATSNAKANSEGVEIIYIDDEKRAHPAPNAEIIEKLSDKGLHVFGSVSSGAIIHTDNTQKERAQ